MGLAGNAVTDDDGPPRPDIARAPRSGPKKMISRVAALAGSAGAQAGILFVLVGVIVLASDEIPGTVGHGQPLAVAASALTIVAGVICTALPWSSWDTRWTVLLACLGFGDIALSTVASGAEPSYGIYFIIIFAWIGAWHRPWTSLWLAPIATVAYLAPALAGTHLPPGIEASVWEVIPVGVLLAETIAHKVSLIHRGADELRYQALHDNLTGLPNRALITDRVTQMLARTEREPLMVGVLFMDLDNFKAINDSFGHPRGDELLRQVGERLLSAVRPGDSVGRLGGDEFVIVVQDESLDAGAEIVAARILEVLEPPFVLPGMEDVPLRAKASIGVAVGTSSDAESLLRDADVALYQAKRSLKGNYLVFRPEMRMAVQDRLGLEMDLRDAVAENQLFVEYQPIFDLVSFELTGVEALVRWRHPRRGVVPPNEFIPIAEESGLIFEVGEFVLHESIRQAATWDRLGFKVPVSVNVSANQLESDDFAMSVGAILERYRIAPATLTLELTETVLMRDTDAIVERLRSLKDLGVRLAVDDFGTGYSSLAYLRKFPVDVLKIDRSFVHNVSRSKEAATLIHTLVQLGRSLGLDTVAEGIEDEAQLFELRREGCLRGQGYYYSRPLAPAAIRELLQSFKASELEALLNH